jgi:hypothetical protein
MIDFAAEPPYDWRQKFSHLYVHPSKQKSQFLEGNWQRAVQLTLDYKILRLCQFLLTAINILCIIRKQLGIEYRPLPVFWVSSVAALGTFFLAHTCYLLKDNIICDKYSGGWLKIFSSLLHSYVAANPVVFSTHPHLG